MPSCNLFTAQCFTGKQSIGCPQEEQAGSWVENLLFKGDQPLGLHPLHLLGRGSETSKTTTKEIEPYMQEVVRAEVLKLLQAGIIYPIYDST